MSKNFPHDMNKAQTTRLYNSEVTKLESYKRPKAGIGGKLGIPHTGVVATTKDGGRYLIHKGPGYGKASSTVVTDAKHMSNNWVKTKSKSTSGHTVSDFMKAGGVKKTYGVFPGQDICWSSTRKIMKKAD